MLDVCSGSVHVVDDLVYDMIALYEGRKYEEIEEAILEKYGDTYSKEDIQDAYSDISELEEREELFTEDVYKDVIIDFKKRKTVVKALCLHIAHDCNLACKYCFADEGEYHGQKRELMSLEVGKQAIDFLIENSGNRVNLEVDFFGGEPLMNFDVVKEIVAYGRSKEKAANKNFRFTLTTNGMLLNDEVIDFCNKEISNVVLSLDGRKEINDRMRPTRNGKGSYDIIVPKFQKFVEKRGDKSYYVRGTFTRNNLDFMKDFELMTELGFKEISIEPVVTPDENDYAIREEDLPVIFEQYDKLAVDLIRREKEGKPVTFFHYKLDLNGGPCVYKRLSGCGSGTTSGQALVHARSTIQVKLVMEECYRFSFLLPADQVYRQLIILLEDYRQVFLTDRIIVLIRCDNRLNGYLLEAKLCHELEILHKIQIISRKCTAHVIALVATLLHKLLELRHDDIVAALTVSGRAHPVVDLFSTVKAQHNVRNLFVAEVNDFVV